ncbi:substrate-binding domain-containing protein [Streptomyces sp. NPDC007875]|uniref:substrate-binding domain-containing protein n=1 Tax=Streptomyces sp. NPDC007875 TaxID=3364783 RepID=UPI0036B0B1E2
MGEPEEQTGGPQPVRRRRAAESLMTPTSAVLVSNDQMAVGVLRALHEAGRRVPEDVSVVCYDDIPEAEHLLPPLTTVRTDFAEIGRRCMTLMLDHLERTPEPGVRVTIPTELVVRRSSGPAPRD